MGKAQIWKTSADGTEMRGPFGRTEGACVPRLMTALTAKGKKKSEQKRASKEKSGE